MAAERPQQAVAARKPRIVILGGGMAGITAAFELSRPGWKERFESITVYQRGWRLGGKGASGRAMRGVFEGRIEEHGLHLWLGFYENAFRMLRECYDELSRPAGAPLATIEDAFEPASLFVAREERRGTWLPWRVEFPMDDKEMPGAPGTRIPPLWECLLRALALALQFVLSIETGAPIEVGPGLRPVSPPPAHPDDWAGLTRLIQTLGDVVVPTVGAAVAAALEFASRLDASPERHSFADHEALRGLVERAADAARRLLPNSEELPDGPRRIWYLADLLLACVRGVLRHGLLFPPGIDAIDHFEFSEWLAANGASPQSIHCPLVKNSVYDLAFAYRDGDKERPSVSAATALRGLARFFFTYRGAIAWRMRAGMGDTVFAPLYEVLRRRDVAFKFFHEVTNLQVSRARRRILSIDLDVQLGLRDEEYHPLVSLNDLPSWPNEPLREQLVGAGDVDPNDLESYWSKRPPAGTNRVRVDTHRDQVVLAIPVGAHRFICGDLMKGNPAWERMVDQLGTIRTQAFQLWLDKDLDQSGGEPGQVISGGYLEPFDTCADMRQLIRTEGWKPRTVRGIAYFCNVMRGPHGAPRPERSESQKWADAEVKRNAIAFLVSHMAELWPNFADRYPTDFKWDVLYGPGTGRQKFDSQYWRANIDPSERYVLSLPGTSRHRLAPDASGYDNLVLAGDWTACGLNTGCVESAVISGMLAARAIDKRPTEGVVGWKGW
jgi:uncharacterized protein with NAD-binding domain and iron-sulfur cluster